MSDTRQALEEATGLNSAAVAAARIEELEIGLRNAQGDVVAACARIQALETSLAEVTEDRDLWKQSEAVASAQYDKACEKLAEAEGTIAVLRERLANSMPIAGGNPFRSAGCSALASDPLLDRDSPSPPPVV